ncbi:MAG: hypothetical protein FWF59_11735 [Turicibacter sp.]|nr:hypothetical protein [Turicibacter sp.]
MKKTLLLLMFSTVLSACGASEYIEPSEDEVKDSAAYVAVPSDDEAEGGNESLSLATSYEDNISIDFPPFAVGFQAEVDFLDGQIVVSSPEVGFEMENWDEVVISLVQELDRFNETQQLPYSLRLEDSDGMIFLILEADGRIYDFTSTFTEARVVEVLRSWLEGDWDFSVDILGRAVRIYHDQSQPLPGDAGPMIGELLSAVNDLETTFGYAILLEWYDQDELLLRIEHNEVTYSALSGQQEIAGSEG